jgi:hypothetical protein
MEKSKHFKRIHDLVNMQPKLCLDELSMNTLSMLPVFITFV